MKCPQCDETLLMTDRQGVEIDYCPNCRGVWLDRGELDKLIERSENTVPEQSIREKQYDRNRDRDYDDHRPHYRKKKKESFLGDLFDF